MSSRAWILFAAVSVIWGVPYLFIKLAVDGGASPLLVAWGRVAIGAALLLPIAWKMGYLGELRGRAKPLVAFAIAECALPWWLIPLGEQHVSSSLAAILIASLPLLIALLAIRYDQNERVRGSRLVGLFIGLAGVVLLLGIEVAGAPEELLGAAAILGATLCYAVGPLIVRRHFTDVNAVGPVAAALGLSTVMLAPAGIASIPGSEVSGDAIASIVVLGVVCSALALMLFFALITDVGASRASVITYVNPVVAVALGVALLGESVGAAAVAGLLLILAGSWLSTGGGVPPGLAAIVTPLRRRYEGRPRRAGPRAETFRRVPGRAGPCR
jgi:drug/metabolite transporter (DMT)-like permease